MTQNPATRTNRNSVLVIATLCAFVVPFLVSSINVALPKITAQFHMEAVVMTWVNTIYFLAIAMVQVPMGRLADIYGRKKLIILGILISLVSAVVGALANSVGVLLVSRAFHDPDLADRDSLAEPAQWVDSVIHYLHANYHRKITLTELSRRFNTNRTTLASQFQQATGQSVIAYLRGLRMNVAASILRDTKLSLEEIMQHVGFSDSTHFGRTFRRYSGFTPSQYRRENCWMLRDGGSCPPAAEWDCGSGSY